VGGGGGGGVGGTPIKALGWKRYDRFGMPILSRKRRGYYWPDPKGKARHFAKNREKVRNFDVLAKGGSDIPRLQAKTKKKKMNKGGEGRTQWAED